VSGLGGVTMDDPDMDDVSRMLDRDMRRMDRVACRAYVDGYLDALNIELTENAEELLKSLATEMDDSN
jgi:hypothetical protein